MDAAWLNDFRMEFTRHMNVRAPFEQEAAPEGFRTVACYIQKGLGGLRKMLMETLSLVDEFQSPRGEYGLCLFSFGWEDGRLRHPERPFTISRSANVYFLADTLAELAGMESSSKIATIPRLLPEEASYGALGPLGRRDLPLFICRNRDVRLASPLKKEYFPLRPNAVWLFLEGGGGNALFGHYVPSFANLS